MEVIQKIPPLQIAQYQPRFAFLRADYIHPPINYERKSLTYWERKIVIQADSAGLEGKSRQKQFQIEIDF